MRPLLITALTLLCSHAAATKLQPPAPVADAPARLIINRDGNAPTACDVELYLNEQVVATLAPNQHTSLDVPSGQMSLAVAISPSGYCGGTGPTVAQSIIVAPGETRQFDVVVKPEQIFLSPRLSD
ncbi:conserved exported hypothetical protein [Pseudomonas sp. 8Z]|uniref:hypothetical protein n=1 Tax=Pseudomonas sp. 8Z TaxID=2653166 RepID=UPI0012F3417A|nr:hypothetical protein [Pseudomonas sp. 8Z]VXC37698.1 conserved exported hypothetical protein [Pseudomonas sp. 8Z]